MKNQAKQLKLIAEQMTTNPLLIVDTCIIKPGIDDSDLQETEKFYRLQLPAQLKDFYKEIGSLCLLWRIDTEKCAHFLREPDESVGGIINLLDPDTMIADKTGNFWHNIYWFQDREMPQNDLRKKFKPFDHHGTEMAAGFLLEEKEFARGLYLYDKNTEINKFCDSLGEYVNSLIRYRGFEYWPLAVNDASSSHKEKMDYYLPILFP